MTQPLTERTLIRRKAAAAAIAVGCWLLAVAGSLLAVALPAHATANVSYRNITMDDGLPSNTVRNVVQDGLGFIWMGTDNGLCRYDGMHVLTYRIPQLGSNQYVSALLAVGNCLYIGTEQGVFRLDAADSHFERLPIDISTAVTHLTFDSDGQLWVSTMGQGVFRYHPTTSALSHYDLGPIASVFVDNSNQVWTVSKWGAAPVCRLNRLHDKFDPVALSGVENCHSLCMLQTSDGRLWLGSWEHGLLRLHSDGHLEQAMAGHTHIHTLTERPDGTICIGCDDGVVSYDPTTATAHPLLEANRHADRFAYSILNDHEGGLWIGTFYTGVCYLSPVGRRFSAVTADEGLNGNIISRFCEDPKGNVWIGSDDGGLMCYSPLTADATLAQQQRTPLTPHADPFRLYPHRQELEKLNIHALALKDNGLWIGTYSDGLYILDIANGQLQHYTHTDDANSLDDNSVYAILHDSRQRTWAATMRGLNRYNHHTGTFERTAHLGALTIDIVEDSDGTLWMATQGAGLWSYQPDSRRLRQYTHQEGNGESLPSNQVNAVLVDKLQRLWVGTASGLCYLADAAKGRFHAVPFSAPTSNILGIVENQGELWLTTDRGIVRYEPHPDNTTPQRFTRYHGLVSEQSQPSAVMKATDGRIFVGTTGGFNMFYPNQIKTCNIPPRVYVTRLDHLSPHDDQLTADADATQLPALPPSTVALSHGQARMLTLTFAALSYLSPTGNQYDYIMDGFDRSWNHTSGISPKATYTNLPPGTYTFRVRAANSDGVRAAQEATLTIRVRPPLWWSWWAKTLYLVLIALALWYFVHTLLKRAESRHRTELQRLSEQKEKENREAQRRLNTGRPTPGRPSPGRPTPDRPTPSPSLRGRGEYRLVGELSGKELSTPLPLREGPGVGLPGVGLQTPSPLDNELLTRMNRIIEDNIANADLNVNFVAQQLNISRSGLFAKIKALTDATPNEMIQVVRLNHAARLLLETDCLVSQVAYMVGFTSPSYFSKCFQKQFGVKPADYAKNGRHKDINKT